jgi:hypothetical protein
MLPIFEQINKQGIHLSQFFIYKKPEKFKIYKFLQ